MGKYDSRYDRLRNHLKSQASDELRTTFAEIEGLIGKLPKSAKTYRMWWSNNASNHAQAKAWLDAGYRTEQVDMEKGELVFARIRALRGMAESASEFGAMGTNIDKHPMIGSMKGTFTIEPGWDLTKPALDPEEWAEWEASLDRKADLVAKGPSAKS